MNPLIVELATVFFTMGFIVILRPLARAIGLVDRPDARKMHVGEIPLVGGIAIFLALIVAAAIGWLLLPDSQAFAPDAAVFMAAAMVLIVVGVWDDLRNLSPYMRIVAQVSAALIMIYGAGNVITDLGAIGLRGEYITLGIWSVPFTVFVTVGIINAINMADGLDGLVGNLVLVTLLGLGAAVAIWDGQQFAPMLNLISAAIIGFLLFNQRVFWRSRAAVFLGDAGSMMLGFALAWATIAMSQEPNQTITPASALWFIAVPVVDTVSVSVRRLLEGKSPVRADSRHLHHLFVNAGFSVTETIAFLCGYAMLGIMIGLSSIWFQVPGWIVVAGFILLWFLSARIARRAWLTGRFLGHELKKPEPNL